STLPSAVDGAAALAGDSESSFALLEWWISGKFLDAAEDDAHARPHRNPERRTTLGKIQHRESHPRDLRRHLDEPWSRFLYSRNYTAEIPARHWPSAGRRAAGLLATD